MSQPKLPPTSSLSSGPKHPWKSYALIGLLGLTLICFILTSIPTGPPPVGPTFRKDGELTLVSGTTGEPITQVNIEIAADRESITKGLMYRESMAADQGMLFIMDGEKPRSFWMLNTYISLDIIYISADKRIVSIREKTTPRSTDQVRSGAPAAYVLEVNAGFAEHYGLRKGDELRWQ